MSNVISQLWQNLQKLLQKLKHHCPQKVSDGCLNVFYKCLKVAAMRCSCAVCWPRGCHGGMEHAAVVRWGIIGSTFSQRSYSSFKFSSPFSSDSEFLGAHQLSKGVLVLCRLKVDPEKDIKNISEDIFSFGGKFWIFIREWFLNVTVRWCKHFKNIIFRFSRSENWKKWITIFIRFVI